jgi:3',5'-cyclic AMP phosphodiesterase CpdA
MKKIKQLIHFRLMGLIIGLIFCGDVFSQTDTLSFLHISDLHLIFNLNSYQPDLAQNRKQYGQGITPLKQFLQTMPRKTKSDLVVATGDLIDFYEGETTDGGMMDFQVEQFSRLIGECPVPVLLTLGNHDIVAYSWEENLRASTQNVAGVARAAWIRSIPCFRNGTYYSRIFDVSGTKYRLIFLENGYYTVHQGENIVLPYIERPQLHWLEDQLQQSPDDVEIVLMHLPVTATVAEPVPTSELYSVLAKSPSAKMIIAGHNHKNAVQSFISLPDHKITQVQTGAFTQSPQNWRLIKLTKDQILVSFPGKTEIEFNISAK